MKKYISHSQRKVYPRFKDKIWATGLSEVGSFSSKNVKYLLCVIDIFTKYAWFKLNRGKIIKVKQFLMALWVDPGREIYNKPMHKWLDNNDILMYSTHYKGKSVIAERFIKQAKIFFKNDCW